MTELNRKRLAWGAGLFGAYTLLGLLNFTYCYLDGAAHGEPGSALGPLIEEMAGVYGGMMLLPLVIWSSRRFRPSEGRWLEAGFGHLGACVTRSLLHTSWNGLSRMALFPLAGLGAYDYGAWSIRFWMELPNDIASYVYTLAMVSAWTFCQESRKTDGARARRVRRLLVRSGRSAALLPLEKIDWVQAARNYAEIHSDGRTYLIRGGLSALEEQLDSDDFVRVNRSQLVRVEFIQDLKATDHGEFQVTLQDGTTLSWTRRYRERTRGLILEAL